MRKPQKVEGLGLPRAALLLVPRREAAELDDARLIGVKLQARL
jgi:hypothetical protein